MYYLRIDVLIFIIFLFAIFGPSDAGSIIRCGDNEVYRCNCFESSCAQLLYDGELCPEKCDKACQCKVGFVRHRGLCVKKEKCCAGGFCTSEKEAIIKPLRVSMKTPTK
ncbi:hypothetical protein ACLKA7_010379 [Drosophila subpalustris]